MGRNNRVIKTFRFLSGAFDRDVSGGASHLLHRTTKADTSTVRVCQYFDILLRTAGNDLPLGALIHAEHAVIVKKLDEELDRYPPHLLWVSRPDRRAHRDQVLLNKFL